MKSQNRKGTVVNMTKEKRIGCAVFICITLLMTGCSTEEGKKDPSMAESLQESTVVSTEETETGAFSFADLQDVQFVFSSGVGAWSTDLTIAADGSFTGCYSDADMGTTGDDYPYGTIYYCNFSGMFTKPVKVDEYTYRTSIETISYKQEAGTEEIAEGVKFVYSDAYGLGDAEDILIYLPGKPVSELPEGYVSWVDMQLYIDDAYEQKADTLPFYGIYNEAAEEGFAGYENDELPEDE